MPLNYRMSTNKLIREVESLISKIKRQDIEFGLYLEKHLILDKESDFAYYFGKGLTETELPLIIISD